MEAEAKFCPDCGTPKENETSADTTETANDPKTESKKDFAPTRTEPKTASSPSPPVELPPILRIKLLQARRALFEECDSEKASRILGKAVENEEANEELHALYLLSLIDLGDEKIEQALRIAQERHPDSSLLLSMHMECLRSQGKNDELDLLQASALEKHPNSHWVNAKLLEREIEEHFETGAQSAFSSNLADGLPSPDSEIDMGGYSEFLSACIALAKGEIGRDALSLQSLPYLFHAKRFSDTLVKFETAGKAEEEERRKTEEEERRKVEEEERRKAEEEERRKAEEEERRKAEEEERRKAEEEERRKGRGRGTQKGRGRNSRRIESRS